MNVEALTIIGGGAMVLLFLIAPVAIWSHRRSSPRRDNEPVLTRVGLILVSIHAISMLAAAIVATFLSGIAGALIFVGTPLILWRVGLLLHQRGLPMASPRPNKSLERGRGG